MEVIKMRYSSKYKLRNTWGKMCRSGKNSFESFEEFKAWSNENGFKPWKSLTLLVDDDSYSKENCVWVISKKGISSIQDLSFDRSGDNIIRHIKTLSLEATESKLEFNRLLDSVIDMEKYNIIDRGTSEDLSSSLRIIVRELSRLENSVEKMSVKSLE